MLTAISRIASLLAIACLGVALIVACGGDSEPSPDPATISATPSPTIAQTLSPTSPPAPTQESAPTTTPTPTAAPTPAAPQTPTPAALSLEEYLLLCAELDESGEGLDVANTYGEMQAAVLAMIESLSAASPPAEVADWHKVSLEVVLAMNTALDALPDDQEIGVEIMEIYDVYLEFEDSIIAAENALPADIRRRMAEAGCAQDPEQAEETTSTTVTAGSGTEPDLHGDDLQSATSISLDEPVEGVLNSPDDKDSFALDAESGQRFAIEMTTPGGFTGQGGQSHNAADHGF